MKNEIEAMITDITTTTAEAEDYTGEDGLLYCGKCHTPKEAYFSKETAQWLGHDRHPTDCDCQRAAREKQQAAESRQKHLETVEDLKRRGFADPAMRNWTFEHDNGRNPQTETARFYVESWETMLSKRIQSKTTSLAYAAHLSFPSKMLNQDLKVTLAGKVL